MERKMKKRRDKRRKRNKGEEAVTIATWNMQKTAINENNRGRLQNMVKYIEKENWKIVLATEITVKERGVTWLGEGSHLTAVIHSENAAIILRSEALEKWREGKQNMWFSKRAVRVRIEIIKLISAYQPTTRATREKMEEYGFEIETHLSSTNREEKLVIGGDHNSHIGANTNRPRMSGRYDKLLTQRGRIY